MKFFTKTLMPAAIIMGSLFTLPAMATELKIGVIDMRSIISGSPQEKAAMEKLKKEFKAREEQIISTGKSLKEKSDKLQRNASVMSEAEKGKLEKEVMAGQRDLQRMQTEFRDDANVRQQEEMKKIMTKVNASIEEIAKKGKYDLIIHSEVAPYSAKTLDITDQVKKSVSGTA